MTRPINRDAVAGFVLTTVRDTLGSSGLLGPETSAAAGPQTALLGPGAVVDSMGLVLVIVNLEQKLEEEFGARVLLADERALSQRHSPFRTIGMLGQYVFDVLSGLARNDRV